MLLNVNTTRYSDGLWLDEDGTIKECATMLPVTNETVRDFVVVEGSLIVLGKDNRMRRLTQSQESELANARFQYTYPQLVIVETTPATGSCTLTESKCNSGFYAQASGEQCSCVTQCADNFV